MKISSTFPVTLILTIVIFSCKKEEEKISSSSSVPASVVDTTNVIVDSTLIDSIPPIIYLIGNTSVNSPLGEMYIDSGATCQDNINGDISSNIIVTGVPDGSVVGKYLIEYNALDSAGNSAIPITRDVSISYTGEQMAGEYEVVEDCNGTNYNYNCSINSSSNSIFTLLYFNFADVFTDLVYGFIDANEITIPLQYPVIGGTFSLEGIGTITINSEGKKVMAISYTVITSETTNCTMVATQL